MADNLLTYTSINKEWTVANKPTTMCLPGMYFSLLHFVHDIDDPYSFCIKENMQYENPVEKSKF